MTKVIKSSSKEVKNAITKEGLLCAGTDDFVDSLYEDITNLGDEDTTSIIINLLMEKAIKNGKIKPQLFVYVPDGDISFVPKNNEGSYDEDTSIEFDLERIDGDGPDMILLSKHFKISENQLKEDPEGGIYCGVSFYTESMIEFFDELSLKD